MKKNYFPVSVDSIDFKVYQLRKSKVDGETERFNITDNFKLKKGAYYSSFKLAQIMLYKLGLLYAERINLDRLLTEVKGAVDKDGNVKKVKAKSALSLSAPLYFELSWKGVKIDTLHVNSTMTNSIKLTGENPIMNCLLYLTTVLNVVLKSLDVKDMAGVQRTLASIGVETDKLKINENYGLMRELPGLTELKDGSLAIAEADAVEVNE
jgi:hypothetical protein